LEGFVRRNFLILAALIAASLAVEAQTPAGPQNAPRLPFEVITDFLKHPATMNLGEVLSVAVNSKGEMLVLNHPGSPTTGPLYGNATTQLLLFDRNGRFVKEIGQGVYGLGYAHSVRYDRYDNLWVVDKGTNSVMKFNPAGYVVMNLGRRPEGYDSKELEHPEPAEARPVDGLFNGPTDIAWDGSDNIYISEGYVNNRIAKFDKNGNWIKTWGAYGEGGDRADQNPGHFRNAHNMQIDRQGNVYVADRGNRRIQVFDQDGQFLRYMYLNVPYDKSRHPVLGNMPPNRPDETQPWALCLTNTTPQYLFAVDQEPGRLYKLTLDGRIVGVFGESGHQAGQFNWPHGIACPSENEVIVADMNNWRVQKLVMSSRTVTSSR
jgi:hypothetical protein